MWAAVQIEKVFAGCVAGAAAILSTYPLETLRTRMSIAGGSVSIVGGIQQIWQQQGIAGFYQVPNLRPEAHRPNVDHHVEAKAWFVFAQQVAAPSW